MAETVFVWSVSLEIVELWTSVNWSKLWSKTSPISWVVEEAVTAFSGGIINPCSSKSRYSSGSFWSLVPVRSNWASGSSGINTPIIASSSYSPPPVVFSGKGIIFILTLEADSTAILVITAKSPITIAVELIATILLNIWDSILPFIIVVKSTFKNISIDICMMVTFFEVGSLIWNSQVPTKSLATWKSNLACRFWSLSRTNLLGFSVSVGSLFQ